MSYVFFSPTAFTGGPLAVHQAASEICRQGGQASVLYFSPEVGSKRIRADRDRVWIKKRWYQKSPSRVLDKYLANFHINAVEYASIDSIFIVPETSLDIAQRLIKAGAKNVYIWWLSVDNVNLSKIRALESQILLHSCGHLCQSHYAADFLRQFDLKNIEMLTDYTDLEPQAGPCNFNEREFDVAFLPSKARGSEKIIDFLRQTFSVVPLVGMTRLQIEHTLTRCKVFIDFGHHPGKDRIPREAALCGCLPLIRREGAARYYQDVPLSDDFLIDTKYFLDPFAIREKLLEILTNSSDTLRQLDAYIAYIRDEKRVFADQIASFMKQNTVDSGS